ncbi:DEAD/DEAH box helicase family protein [Helicobacter mehlei]|uniref:DEAD/DEAH box helicase n=1 Tax=Helicobacter mehlei TaxID=2316080 RepID=A0A553UKT3_9HELI|nr:DEAD/DEAH box helicase family protein [Helicobacter mehlei]TSA80813.1 DEAD/DEAH box helicase [Helicobacter mehlei]
MEGRMISNLHDEIEKRCGTDNIAKTQIPSHIKNNLSKSLREYQIKALQYYLALSQSDTLKTKNHLMFNMATGSGKTLVMAALMLDCYKKGYRNFVFFVNSSAIVEKTKANFCDDKSSKYLFASPINIDGELVEINALTRFEDSKENAINIYFSTIQGLFSLFKNEKENSLTLEDLKNHKIVFLADEAHHLNADTKSKSDKEKELKEGWESVINKAFASHKENRLFEFSATIPKDKGVQDKYKDKIVFEYDLKSFCKDGYSKRIFLAKYEERKLETRLLGACLASVYREFLAHENGIELKPVVLFKSESIEKSKNNQKIFNAMLENLQGIDIENFYQNITFANEMFMSSQEFFKHKYLKGFANTIATYIRTAFNLAHQINANDEKEASNNQIKLNTLEDSDNETRAIFAVDKLNEGWDVLNLFDIVRLGDAKSATKTTTTKEAQLIGRGARYFPFGEESVRYQRKYDDTKDALTMLERLSYHSLNDEKYISDLQSELSHQGLLFDEKKIEVTLKPSARAQKILASYKLYYVSNECQITTQETNLFAQDIEKELTRIEVPYFGKQILEKEEDFKGDSKEVVSLKSLYPLKEKVKYAPVVKAMHALGITLKHLQKAYPDYTSKRELYDKFFSLLNLRFDKRQTFETDCQLEIAKFLLKNLKELLGKSKQKRIVGPFKAFVFEGKNKTIIASQERLTNSPYDWLYYTQYCQDSGLEAEFLTFIDEHASVIDKHYTEWFILRNERFSEFKLYDNREGSLTYGDGFEPDFIFFGKPRESTDKHAFRECIMEVKGGHLLGRDGVEGADKWKENFLLDELNGKIFTEILDRQKGILCHGDDCLEVLALPFFTGSKDEKFKEFKESFEKLLHIEQRRLF